MQLQYAQMVILNFEILKALPNAQVLIGWPHISVATLRKTLTSQPSPALTVTVS
jgi:hypothetical protein